MKVALIGIGGRVGSRLATELLARGHSVTGIARKVDNVRARPGLTIRQGDATQPAILAPLIAGHNAVFSAPWFQTSDANALIAAVKQAGVKRLLVVGGAGSLEVAPGKVLLEASGLNDEGLAEAGAANPFRLPRLHPGIGYGVGPTVG